VETSPVLRLKQAQALQCPESVLEILTKSVSEQASADLLEQGLDIDNNLRVHWHSILDDIPGEGQLFAFCVVFCNSPESNL
jgi:hypothetical protein